MSDALRRLMSTITRPLAVAEYERRIAAGILGEDDPVELLDGRVVPKMPRGPRHVMSTKACQRLLGQVVGPTWHVAKEDPVRIPEYDEPEPDVAVVRGADVDYRDHHPGPSDVALVVEVAESSLAWDRGEKLPIYARAGLAVYWIINLIDDQVEVHTGPDPGAGTYQARVDYGRGQTVPVVVAGQVVAQIAVAELLP